MRQLRRTRRGISRRKFLQASSAAAVAITAPSVLSAATPPATTSVSRLNVAIIGTGGQGRSDMKQVLTAKENIVAICDLDPAMIAKAREAGGAGLARVKVYDDYRKLLGDKSIDAVLIATPDHWHAPLCKAAILAGKHVYCEKPLTHTVAEARELRELAAAHPKVVTQLGNQGSASPSLRRSVEVVRAGALGQISQIHIWISGGGFPHGMARPEGSDPIPPGFNWDFWCGTSPLRPYKDQIYHPAQWRGWYDFGSGQLGDFACHSFNLPLRALDLGYPNQIKVVKTGGFKENYSPQNQVNFHFAAREKLDACTLHWYDGGLEPEADIVKDVTARYGKAQAHGVLLIGEKGIIYTGPWNNNALIKLNGEEQLHDITTHEATKEIAQSLPRVKVHIDEWLDACKGGPPTFSPFQFGGLLTEIALAGIVAIRVGHDLEWDGQAMRSSNAPEAAAFVKSQQRDTWLG